MGTNRDLEYLFEKYGKIGDIYIPRDKYSKESRGFAFVRFLDRRDAEDAMDSLDGRKYDGREIRIQMAKYARPEPSRGRDRSRSMKDIGEGQLRAEAEAEAGLGATRDL